MDSTSLSAASTASRASSPAPSPAPQAPAPSAPVQAEVPAAERAQRTSSLPENAEVRTRLHFDRDTQRVVAEVVDKKSGEVIDSFPPDLILGFISRTREQMGPMVDIPA